MTDRFLLCLPFVLAQECPFPNDWGRLTGGPGNTGNFSNDAHDPGGKTMCGIIQREYDVFRKAQHETPRDVRKITQDEGQQIYDESYWLPHCPMLPPGLDLSFFDESVNTGPHEAIRILQRSLSINVDGEWGPQTEGAAEALKTPDAVAKAIEAYAASREIYYRALKGFPYFGHGWLSRTQTIRAQSRVMAAKAVSGADAPQAAS